jgi:hypothetical protein
MVRLSQIKTTMPSDCSVQMMLVLPVCFARVAESPYPFIVFTEIVYYNTLIALRWTAIDPAVNDTTLQSMLAVPKVGSSLVVE